MKDRSFEDSENEFKEEDESTGDEKVDLPYVLKLEDPITVGSKTYDEIEFVRKPTAKSRAHLPINSDKHMMGHYDPIIAYMARLPRVVVDELSSSDNFRCHEIVTPFLVPGPKTGA